MRSVTFIQNISDSKIALVKVDLIILEMNENIADEVLKKNVDKWE